MSRRPVKLEPEDKTDKLCPICDMNCSADIYVLCIHIYDNHLPDSGHPAYIKTCFCGMMITTYGWFHVHMEHGHGNKFAWMYDAFHAQMLGVNPYV